MNAERPRMLYPLIKRSFDIVLATLAYVLSLPLQAVIAIAIATNLGRPVLFRQRRPGRHGRVFVLVKFRTMKDIDRARGLVTDEDRLTNLGKFLRSTSLDEIPTLANVIKGDMSLVGPRPLLTEYMDRYTIEQARRHEVRPGITGLAQVNGRNELPWEERLSLDVQYVDRQSFALDLRLISATVGNVMRRRGVTSPGHATMPEFRGNQSLGEPN
ncbi:sugar transferase [Okibacterium endophyticum]